MNETIQPLKVLSVRQPWAWLIVNGYKDVENRSWATNYRETILIHAGAQLDPEYAGNVQRRRNTLEFLMRYQRDTLWWQACRRPNLPDTTLPEIFDMGGIVGMVTITDCVTQMFSYWFSGPYGFTLRDGAPLPFTPCRGQLGFFNPPADVLATLEPHIEAALLEVTR